MKPLRFFLPRLEYILFMALFWSIAASGPKILNFDGDLPRHLLVGRLIRETLSVPRTDTFSFRTIGFPSIPHEWLAQVIFSLSNDILGLSGVRGGKRAWPGEDWESATPASQAMDAERLDKARAWLETHNSKSGLVIRHGRIVAEWYFGGADRNSQFAAYSTSKSLSSMATGLAIADGKLALDHTVGRYFPERFSGVEAGGDRPAIVEHDLGSPQRRSCRAA